MLNPIYFWALLRLMARLQVMARLLMSMRGAHCAGRSLANPLTQLLELNAAYAPYANLAYNGTNLPDVFAPANGGYYVNSTTTVYGYQRLFANATTLTVQVCGCFCSTAGVQYQSCMLSRLSWLRCAQPMDVTTLPAKPFADPNAAFTLV